MREEPSTDGLHIETADVPGITSAALNNRASGLLVGGEYMAALNLIIPGMEFLRFLDDYANGDHSILTSVMRLGRMLTTPIQDQDVSERMFILSKSLLQEAQQCR